MHSTAQFLKRDVPWCAEHCDRHTPVLLVKILVLRARLFFDRDDVRRRSDLGNRSDYPDLSQ